MKAANRNRLLGFSHYGRRFKKFWHFSLLRYVSFLGYLLSLNALSLTSGNLHGFSENAEWLKAFDPDASAIEIFLPNQLLLPPSDVLTLKETILKFWLSIQSEVDQSVLAEMNQLASIDETGAYNNLTNREVFMKEGALTAKLVLLENKSFDGSQVSTKGISALEITDSNTGSKIYSFWGESEIPPQFLDQSHFNRVTIHPDVDEAAELAKGLRGALPEILNLETLRRLEQVKDPALQKEVGQNAVYMVPDHPLNTMQASATQEEKMKQLRALWPEEGWGALGRMYTLHWALLDKWERVRRINFQFTDKEFVENVVKTQSVSLRHSVLATDIEDVSIDSLEIKEIRQLWTQFFSEFSSYNNIQWAAKLSPSNVQDLIDSYRIAKRKFFTDLLKSDPKDFYQLRMYDDRQVKESEIPGLMEFFRAEVVKQEGLAGVPDDFDMNDFEKIRKANKDFRTQHYQAIFRTDQLGEAELNWIDGQLAVFVTDTKTEYKVVFCEEERLVQTPYGKVKVGLDLKSDHFKQFHARTSIGGGASRRDHQSGRDLLVITRSSILDPASLESLLPEKYSVLERPKRFVSMAFWAQYWKAIWKVPTFHGPDGFSPFKLSGLWDSDLGFGLIFGKAQFGLAMLSSYVKVLFVGGDFTFTPAILSFVWGSVMGTFISPYRNWNNINRAESIRFFKSAANGLAFGYCLMALTKGVNFDILDAGVFAVHAALMGNVLANNYLKTFVYLPATIRETLNLSRNPFKMFGYTFKNIKQAAVEFNISYLPLFFGRLIEMMGIPGSSIALYSAIPVMETWGVKYSEKFEASGENKKARDSARKLRRPYEYKRKITWGSRVREFFLQAQFEYYSKMNKQEKLLLVRKKLGELYKKVKDYDGVERTVFEHDALFRGLFLKRELHRLYRLLGSSYDAQEFERVSDVMAQLEPQLVKNKKVNYVESTPLKMPEGVRTSVQSEEPLKIVPMFQDAGGQLRPDHVKVNASSVLNPARKNSCFTNLGNFLELKVAI